MNTSKPRTERLQLRQRSAHGGVQRAAPLTASIDKERQLSGAPDASRKGMKLFPYWNPGDHLFSPEIPSGVRQSECGARDQECEPSIRQAGMGIGLDDQAWFPKPPRGQDHRAGGIPADAHNDTGVV